MAASVLSLPPQESVEGFRVRARQGQGEHTIVLVYEPLSFHAADWTTGSALVVAAVPTTSGLYRRIGEK